MDCVGCSSGAVTARSDLTERCQDCDKQFNERSDGVLNRASLPSDIIAFVVFCRLRYRLTLRDLSRLHDDGGCAACLPLRAGYAQSIAFRVPNSVAWTFRHAGNCSLTKPFPSIDDYPSDHHGTLAAIPFRIVRHLCSTAARRFIRETPRR